MLSHQL
jgi:transposase InsO family protein